MALMVDIVVYRCGLRTTTTIYKVKLYVDSSFFLGRTCDLRFKSSKLATIYAFQLREDPILSSGVA